MTLKLTDDMDVAALLRGVSTKPEITSLSFRRVKFDQNEAAALFTLMKINRKWIHVAFEDCGDDDDDDDDNSTTANSIMHRLDFPIATFIFNDNVKKLSLIHKFTQHTAVAINAALHYTECLETLRIVDTKLTKHNITPLSEALGSINCKLKELDLASCRIFKEFPEEEDDDDDNNNNVVKLLAAGLKSNKSIDKLSIKNCNLPDHDVRDIIQAFLFRDHAIESSILKELDLGYNQCSTATIEALSKLLQSSTCKLERLLLENQQQQPQQTMPIQDSSTTNTNTTVTHAHTTTEFDIKPLANALRNNASLKYVDLSGNQLDDDDIALLVTSLSSSSLATLHLWNNNLSDKGAKSIAKVLPNLHNLKRLYLGGDNPFGKIGTRHILEALELNDSIQYAALPTFTWVREMAI